MSEGSPDPFSAIAGQLIDFGLNSIASSKQASRSRGAAAEANAFTEHMSRHKYQNAMYDLKTAGMNPLLAVGGGISGGGAMGAQASPQMQAGSAGAANAILQNQKLKSEIDLMHTEQGKNLAIEANQREQAFYEIERTEGQKIANRQMLMDDNRLKNDSDYRGSGVGRTTQNIKNFAGDLAAPVTGIASAIGAHKWFGLQNRVQNRTKIGERTRQYKGRGRTDTHKEYYYND